MSVFAMNNQLMIPLSTAIMRARFPLTVLVVMIHTNIAAGVISKGVEYSIDSYLAKYIISLFSHSIGQLAVPTFYIISGYLFAFKIVELSDFKIGIIKRFRSVFLPYMVWNTIAMITILLPRMPFLRTYFPNLSDEQIDFGIILKGYWDNSFGFDVDKGTVAAPWDMPLWYVRDLMVMFLITPILFWLHKVTKYVGLLIVFLIYMFVPSSILMTGFSLTALMFYTLGIYIAKENWGRYFDVIRRKWLMVVILCFCILTIIETYSIFPYYNSVYKIICSILILLMLCNSDKINEECSHLTKYLAGSSFFIFASHTIFNGYVTKLILLVLHFPLHLNFCMTLFLYLSSITVTIVLALVSYELIRRNVYMSVFLTGGR